MEKSRILSTHTTGIELFSRYTARTQPHSHAHSECIRHGNRIEFDTVIFSNLCFVVFVSNLAGSEVVWNIDIHPGFVEIKCLSRRTKELGI